MRIRLFLCCGLMLSLLSACSTVQFKDSQPVNVSAKTTFPNKLIGTYAEDSDTLIIKKDRYISISWDEKKISLSEEPKDYYKLDQPEKGKIYLEKDGFTKGYNYEISGDILTYSEREMEEQLLGEDKLIKSAYGSHFYNILSEEGYWSVVLINKNKKGQLVAKMIDWEAEKSLIPQELRFIEEYDKKGKIEIVVLSHRSEEFKKFLNAGGFSEELFSMEEVQ